jgi:hypothetical protein
MDVVYGLLGLLFFAGWLWVIVVNALKAKWGFFAFAILGSAWSIIGASRLARPNSWWYRKRYDDAKRAVADARYRDGKWWPRRDVSTRYGGPMPDPRSN